MERGDREIPLKRELNYTMKKMHHLSCNFRRHQFGYQAIEEYRAAEQSVLSINSQKESRGRHMQALLCSCFFS